MKLANSLAILCTIPLLVYSINSHHRISKLGLTQPRDGTCLSGERNVRCSTENVVPSCLCYQNGTCISDVVNRCVACSGTTVKSVREGCCSSSMTQPPSIAGLCYPEERNQRCFAYNPVPSCICYMNGTCVNSSADRCSDCSNQDIFSINEGRCNQTSLSHPSDICQPGDRNVQCFAYLPILSCVCYFNGTCMTQEADKCSSCSDDEIASVSKGCCPANLMASPNPSTDCRKTSLKQCNKLNGAMIKCASNYSQGCICYNNGTCKADLVNTCIQCQQDDVFAVEMGSKCPCPDIQLV